MRGNIAAQRKALCEEELNYFGCRVWFEDFKTIVGFSLLKRFES